MPTSNTFYDLSYRLGTFLILLLKLQFFWLLTLLKGGIIFGFFPATAIIFQVFLFLFTNKEVPQELVSWYKKTTKRQFKAINRLGFFYSGILLFLWFDLRIATHFLRHSFVHLSLLLFVCLFILAGFYLLPVFLRYQLTFSQYFIRVFLLMFLNPFQTLAMVISSILTTALVFWCPLFCFLAVPLFLFPIGFFTFQAMQRGENLARNKTCTK